MDTELLRTFLEVRKTRHFSRAADNLCLTHAAVSARIRQLEQYLGAVLFIRSRNNIQLSSEGERLVPHAEAVLHALSRARQEVNLEDAGGAQVFLGVRVGIWSAPLQRTLHGLMRAQPEVVMRVESYEPGDITRKLIQGDLDLAILYEPPSLPELQCTAIGELTLRLYSTRARDTVETAMAGNYVYLDWGGGFSRFHSRQFGDGVVPALRTNMNDVASEYLSQRGGACFLPSSLRARLRGSGLRPVRGAPEFKRSLNVAYNRGSRQRELIETVAGYFGGISL